MNILAAFIFFTRLPFWRIRQVPLQHFKHVVPYWPLTGWLTGGLMAGALYLFAEIGSLPVMAAWALALAVRLLVTGCLHEDGLADFFDGFGGGTSRERTLAIMKDSHIGSYGVIGLIFSFLLLILTTGTLPLRLAIPIALCGDCWGKFCAAQLINCLPYARREEDSKAKVVYNRMTALELLACFACGALPVVLALPVPLWPATVASVVMFILLCRLMRKRLQGYTGDCCGATFLLCELAFHLCAVVLYYHIIS